MSGDCANYYPTIAVGFPERHIIELEKEGLQKFNDLFEVIRDENR